MIDSHCHLDPQYFEALDRAEVLTRARAAGVEAFVCVGVGRGLEAPRARGRAGDGRAGRVRRRRRSPTRRRGDDGGRLGRAGRAGAHAPGSSASARPGSTTTTITRRASCSRRPTGASSAMARAAGLAVVSHVRDAHAEAAAILRDGAGRRRRHPLLLGRRGRGARLPGPGPAPVVLRDPDVQERGQHARGRGVRAARPHPDRDRRAVPGARSPTGARRTNPPTSPRRWPRWRRCAGCRSAEVDAATIGERATAVWLAVRRRAGASADTRSAFVSSNAPVRIRLRFASFDTFIDKFAPNVTRGGVFLASRTPLPIGSTFAFEIQLAGGEVALAGDGKVTWVKAFDPAAPQKPHGMGVQFLRLDNPSRELLNKILARKAARRGPGAAARRPWRWAARAPTASARTAPRRPQDRHQRRSRGGVRHRRGAPAPRRRSQLAGREQGRRRDRRARERCCKPEPIEPVVDRAGAGRAAAHAVDPAPRRAHERRLPARRRAPGRPHRRSPKSRLVSARTPHPYASPSRASGRGDRTQPSFRFLRMRALGSSVSGTNGRPVMSSQTWM